jgi:hypothetical protein
MYANAVVDVHEDFDIVDFAETFFDTDHQCLIVREKGKQPHWHVHGTWKGDRKAYKEYPHSDRVTNANGNKTRPVRVAFDKDKEGFQYCCKANPPNVVRKWHITDEQIEEWHRKSNEHNASARSQLKRALAQVSQPTGCESADEPRLYYRALKRQAYAYTVEQGNLIHPAQLKSHIVTYMFATDKPEYINYVLDKH